MRRLFLLLILLSLLISCNETGIGIFYSISQEQPLDDTSLPNTLSVSGMTKGTTKYLLSAGGLYTRKISAGPKGEWDEGVDTPSSDSVDYTLCIRLVKFKGKMYGLFSDNSGNETAVFSTPANAIDWSMVGSFENRLVGLAASESSLFVSERVDYATYVTKVSTDGSAFSDALVLDGQYMEVTDAADFDSETWIISGTAFYSGSGISFSPVTGAGAPSATSGFGGVFYSGGLDILFVSTAGGKVYATGDGSAWDSTTVTNAAGNPVMLFDFEGIEILGTQVIVVGAENGYYDIVFEGGYSSSFALQTPGSEGAGVYSSSDANFLSIELRNSVIRFFYFDAGENTLFACTSGSGLWINPISGGTTDSIIRKWDRQ